MKNFFKKLFSVFLALVMVAVTFPTVIIPVAFAAETENWSYEIENGEVIITDYIGTQGGTIEIPSEIEGYPVTKLQEYIFAAYDTVTAVTIPSSIIVIDEFAFSIADKLEIITVNRDNPVYSSIGDGVLFNKDQSELIQYPQGKTDNWYIIPDGVKKIYDRAFAECKNLVRITLPNSVESIGVCAFYNCCKLTEINIPNGVTNIGGLAFGNCFKLTSITIPESTTSIGENAFSYCNAIEYFEVDEKNTAYSSDEYGVLFNKDKSELIQYPIGNTRVSYLIPYGVISIGTDAFCNCQNLASITISESVKIIGASAFYNCNGFTSITIPDSVTDIGWSAFGWCFSLTYVKTGRSIINIEDRAFSGADNCVFYGYKNSYVETYAAENNINFSAYTSKVTFDANGGTSETAEKEVYTDCAIGSLPIAENSDRVFLGWYTELTGGECVTEDTVITEDCTLYAQWGDPVTSISLVMPTGVKYYVGDSLSNVGIKLKVNYYDGTTKTISSGFSLTPETLSESGSQTVTATYGDHSATATITVLSVQPVSVSVNKLPEKTTYLVGEDFNPKGMKIKVTYNNSTERIIADMSLLEVFYDFSSAGESIVYYSYEENGALVSDYFDVLIYKKPIVSADSISANAGEIVTVPVRISDNCGLMGYNISVKYDSEILTPVSATQGSAISGGLFDTGIETSQDDSFNVIWSGSENVNQNGVLFNIVFEVSEKAIGETLIELGFNQSDTFNESFDDIQLTVKNAEILINNSAFEENTLISMQDASGNAGEEISLKFILSNYTDTTATTVMLEYDSDNFTFVDAQSENISVRATDKGSYILIKLSGMDVSLNGSEIMTMIFKAKEYIEGEFDFELIYDQSVDTYGQAVACKGSKVTVTNLAADETASVYSEKINATIGEKIIVPVKISNNHGIMGYKLIFDYDYNALKPVSVTVGSKFNGNFAENSTSVPGRIYVVWNGNSDVTVDGDLLYIEFEVLQQGDTDILVSYSQGDTFNEAWEDVFLNCKNISVTVHPSELLFAKTGTSTVIDKTNKFIYGIPVGITSLDSYISVTTGYGFSVSGKIGTGAKVSITKNGEVADTYTVIIFGDVNGDGWYDGTDAVIVSCIVNGMLPQAEESVLFAADCNCDGTINETDVAVLEQAGVMLVGVDQTQSVQMLETQSAYIEYADLIVQTVEADFEVEDVTEDQAENEPEAEEMLIIKFIETLLAWIIKLFSVFEAVI